MTARFISFVLLFFAFEIAACELKMGYRTSERLPFINAAPNDEGLYKVIYSKVAENIGCTLSIIRAPKKRILHMLEQGSIDFYPGLGSNEERSDFLFFWPNGLTSHTVAISRQDTPDIYDLKDMNGKVLLIAHGANDFNAPSYGIILRQAFDVSLQTAISSIEQKKADFYLFNEDSINHFLSTNEKAKIKLHPCCFGPTPATLGFSKYSLNNWIDGNTAKNTAFLHSPQSGSVADRFKNEIQRLIDSKGINPIKAAYYAQLKAQNTKSSTN